MTFKTKTDSSAHNVVGIGRVPPDMGVGVLDVFSIRLRSLLPAAAFCIEESVFGDDMNDLTIVSTWVIPAKAGIQTY